MVCRTKKRGLAVLAACAALLLTGCMTNVGANAQFDETDSQAEESLSVEEPAEPASTEASQEETETSTEETETSTEETTPAIDAEGISFPEKTVRVRKGEEWDQELILYPSDANQVGEIEWGSVFPEILQVGEDGHITAVENGNGLFFANLGHSTAVCRVQVYTPMEGIAFAQKEIELDRTERQVLKYSLQPSDTTEAGEIRFESADPSVAEVGSDGTVRPVGLGTTEIKVTAGTFSDVCRVTVKARILAVTIQNGALNLVQGQTGELHASVQPADTTDEGKITYSSSDPAVATVDENGVVTAVNGGNAVITAACGQHTASCEVHVSVPLTGFSLDQTALSLVKGSAAQLTAIYAPANTTVERTPYYSSSNGNVAVVDGNGVVTAVGAGSAVITAQIGGFSASCTVNVSAPLQAIGLDKASVKVWRGSQASLAVGFDPWDTTDDRTVTWSVDNPAVATVSGGVITGVSVGSCVVTATVGGKSASCTVIVEEPSSDIVLVFDPGHGGHDPGALNGSLQEKVLTLKTALYCKQYLESHYSGVKVYMTRTEDVQLQADATGTDLRARCEYAYNVGARAMISFHFNASNNKDQQGCLALISKQPGIAMPSSNLADQILAQLSALGIRNRGPLMVNSVEQFDANGAPLDYYAINRHCAALGFPGIIIEHCYMDNNAHDVAFCDSDEDLQRLGQADAIGIANYFGLPSR